MLELSAGRHGRLCSTTIRARRVSGIRTRRFSGLGDACRAQELAQEVASASGVHSSATPAAGAECCVFIGSSSPEHVSIATAAIGMFLPAPSAAVAEDLALGCCVPCNLPLWYQKWVISSYTGIVRSILLSLRQSRSYRSRSGCLPVPALLSACCPCPACSARPALTLQSGHLPARASSQLTGSACLTSTAQVLQFLSCPALLSLCPAQQQQGPAG